MKSFRLFLQLALAAGFLLTAPTIARAQAVNTIDVLGIYSDHTAQQVADPAALFVRNIEYANRALANSAANYRYNLVHVQQSNWVNDDSLGSSQLQSFARDTNIRALREQYGADLVAGIVPSSSGLCGIGYLPISSDGQTIRSFSRAYAYSLSGYNCGGRTMAHEMGHNAGLGHSAAQNSSGSFGNWARGHGVEGNFVTIMAYNGAYGVYSSAGRIQVHSNPNISICNDQPCGVDHTLSNGADAVRALNMASPQIAAYTASTTSGPINLPPEASDDSATTDEGHAVTLNVLNNDSDPEAGALTLVSVSPSANGTASVESASGDVRYVPDDGFFGADRFDYVVRDAGGETATATVSVVVNEVDDGGPLPPEDQNLLVNGDAEAGLDGWSGVWGTTVSLAAPGLDGEHSARATGGYAVNADLRTPIAGGRQFTFSAMLRGNQDNRVYAYLRIQRNGRWSYVYVSSAELEAGQDALMQRSFELPDGDISDGFLMFYFPNRLRGEILVDLVRMEAE